MNELMPVLTPSRAAFLSSGTADFHPPDWYVARTCAGQLFERESMAASYVLPARVLLCMLLLVL